MNYTKRLELYNLLNLKINSETDYKLSKTIFIILKKNKDSFSENSNGIFFDLNDISTESLKEIEEAINRKESIDTVLAVSNYDPLP